MVEYPNLDAIACRANPNASQSANGHGLRCQFGVSGVAGRGGTQDHVETQRPELDPETAHDRGRRGLLQQQDPALGPLGRPPCYQERRHQCLDRAH